MTTSKVFISYSHDSEEHKAWVADLARFLISNGIDVVIDAWNLRRGGLSDELKRLDEHRARLKEAGLRAAKILDALHVRLRTQVAIEPLPPFPVAHAS